MKSSLSQLEAGLFLNLFGEFRGFFIFVFLHFWQRRTCYDILFFSFLLLLPAQLQEPEDMKIIIHLSTGQKNRLLLGFSSFLSLKVVEIEINS